MNLFQISGLFKNGSIQYACEMIYGMLNISVCFLNRDGELTFEYYDTYTCNPIYSNKVQFYKQLCRHDSPDGFPLFTTTKYLENFFTISVIQKGKPIGTIIVGPAIPSEIDENTIYELAEKFEVPLKLRKILISYFQSIPVIEHKKLINTSMLLYYMLYGKMLDSAAVIERNAFLKNSCDKIDSDINIKLSTNRQYNIHHHNLIYEKYLLEYIKEGNREKLLDHLTKPAGGKAGVLSKNPLRSQKNLFICSATLAARAAIEGGLSSELAFTISDSYIQHVEELNEINEVINLHYKMLCDFTDRVHKVKEHGYSKAVVKCLNYICKHLYEDISLSQLAQTVGMNSNYLSQMFKKQTGISISGYIQKERVEEAKKRLELSNDSIMDISTSLNFTDQSYFTKIFRKFTGITPKQYRSKFRDGS